MHITNKPSPHPRLPSLGLASSFNLGKADIYPATSGKAPAVSRLMRRLHADPQECVALFDDDNDLGMAQLCKPGRRVAVSITHDSVRQVCVHTAWGLVAGQRRAGQGRAHTTSPIHSHQPPTATTQLVASDPRVETGGPRPGILATEEALRRVLASLLMGGDEAAARVMADWVV